jgi:N-acylneuraminate cytidylyltransferase/CMP-N,N'-diacetyllegionaminic acid synthase
MIAIIPARGGSKGVPRKNIRMLSGKPLIAYTIEVALKSKCISEVILSTDDKEIESIATQYGAKSPFLRPPELATDNALAIDAYIYTINRLINEYKYDIKEFIILQPTSPLRSVEDIDGAIELFNIKRADSIISYTKEHHPIEWHKYITDDGKFKNIFEGKLSNRQDTKGSYYPNGAIYIFKFDLIKQKKYYSINSYAYIMPNKRSVDIDTIDDFEYAEYLLNRKSSHAR